MTSEAFATTPARGRPREFDIDEALDAVVRIFCERGFHATSIGDLTAATGLTSGSLYKAFKDKRGLYVAALTHYKDSRDAALRDALAPARTGLERVRAALIHYAEASHGERGRLGCLVTSSATELATFDAELGRWVTGSLRRSEALLAGLLRQGIADGTVPPDVDPEVTGRFLLCVVQGMRVVGKTGLARKDTLALVEVALKALA